MLHWLVGYKLKLGIIMLGISYFNGATCFDALAHHRLSLSCAFKPTIVHRKWDLLSLIWLNKTSHLLVNELVLRLLNVSGLLNKLGLRIIC